MHVSILLVRMLLSESRRRGLADQRLISDSGVDMALLANVHGTISAETWHDVLGRAVWLTGDPGFGLSMGRHGSLLMLQMIGQLMLGAPSLRDALGVLDRHQAALAGTLQQRLDEGHDRARWYVDATASGPAPLRAELDFMLAFLVRAGGMLVPGATAADTTVCFRRPPPTDGADYARAFPCRVAFGQPYDGITFPHAYLDRARSYVQSPERALIHKAAELLLREGQTRSVTQSVRSALARQPDLGSVDTGKIAALVKMSTRQLRRKLAEEGTAFSVLLDEARLQVAQSRLLVPELTIKAVASELGFSEPSAFHRAFKRWTGETPADFVKRHRGSFVHLRAGAASLDAAFGAQSA